MPSTTRCGDDSRASSAVSIDLDADGARAYVANSGSNSVSVIDLKARREVAQIGAGDKPVAARLAPMAKLWWSPTRRGNSVTLIDPANRPACARCLRRAARARQSVVILPDSSKAFVACSAGHQVMVIALAKPKAPPINPIGWKR
jgi:YVTN family beta-propeller protein